MFGFHFQMLLFAIKLQINADFYLYIKRSALLCKASNKIMSCFADYSFVNFLRCGALGNS